jgi:hypothetical protein
MAEDWTFLTNHGLVLLTIARQPDIRLRDVAIRVGITERAAQDIVNALVVGGYVERVREGRRNRYLVRGERPLRHPLTWDRPAADLIGALTSEVRMEPGEGECDAVVLACSDYRFQDGLRQFLASEGLLGRSEIVLWPGGGAALTGPQQAEVLAQLELLVSRRHPRRILLVAHQGCTAEGIFRRERRSAPGTYRALVRERRRALARLKRRLGATPELWFTDTRRTRRIVLHAPSDSAMVADGAA